MSSHPRTRSTSKYIPAPLSTTSVTSGAGQWSTSDKYVRFELREKEKFERVMRQRAKAESRSPFLPSTWREYLSHRADHLDDRIAAGKAAISMREELSRARRRNPASAEVVQAFGGRDLRGVASCSLEDYGRWRGTVWLFGEDVVKANREMDGDEPFRRKGELLVGKDLMRIL